MNYVLSARARRRALRAGMGGGPRRSARTALGFDLSDALDIFGGAAVPIARDTAADTIFSAPSEGDCLTSANGSDAVSSLDARRDALSKTWNPTGFYTPAQIHDIVTQMQTVLATMTAVVLIAPRTTSDADFSIRQAVDDAVRKTREGDVYLQAAQQVEARGSGLVDAPGLKRWVLSALGAASNAMTTAAVLQCSRTWLDATLVDVQRAFDVAASVISKIAGVIAKQGEFLLKVPDLIDNLVTIGKWGLLIGGGVFVAMKVKEYRRGK